MCTGEFKKYNNPDFHLDQQDFFYTAQLINGEIAKVYPNIYAHLFPGENGCDICLQSLEAFRKWHQLLKEEKRVLDSEAVRNLSLIITPSGTNFPYIISRLPESPKFSSLAEYFHTNDIRQ